MLRNENVINVLEKLATSFFKVCKNLITPVIIIHLFIHSFPRGSGHTKSLIRNSYGVMDIQN
jgi:hypothetical protein